MAITASSVLKNRKYLQPKPIAPPRHMSGSLIKEDKL